MAAALDLIRATFDDELFVRTGRGMRPTARALALAGPLRRALSEIEGMFEDREAFDPMTAQRTFVIAALDYTLITHLAPWISSLPETAPKLDIVVRQLSPQTKRDLESGAVDLFVSPKLRSAAGVIWTHLADDDYGCLVDENHPVRRLTLARYAKLDHVLVAPGERPGGVVDRALRRQGIARRVSVQVPSFSSVPPLLLGTQRISTIPYRVAEHFASRHPLRLLKPPLDLRPVSLYIGWHELHRKDPGHAWLRNQFIERAREL